MVQEKITESLSRFKDFLKQIVEHRHINIFVFIWSFIFGILVSSFVFISPLFSLLLIVVSIAIFISYLLYLGKVEKEIVILVLLILAFSLGAFRYAIKDFHILETPMSTGVVVSEPEVKEKNMRFVFKSDNHKKILVSTNLYSDIRYGDKIKIDGKLETPGIIAESDSPQNAGQAGRSFDYGAYLSKDDIYYTMNFAQVNIISRDNGNKIKSGLLKFKESFVDKMKVILVEPESSLLAGLLVSGKQALPTSIIDEFKRAGVVHIVVLSGYNIMIVAEFFKDILGFLSLRLASSISIFSIILFVLMTGATATVVRAAIMALIAVSGKMFGRSYSVHRALLVAGFLMLLENPKILIFDPSFQLSMLATIAMIYAVPIVDRYLSHGALAKWDKFREILSATISTQIFVLPFLLYSMGNVSIVSLFSNILILAFVPYTMLIGFIATTLVYMSSVLALPFTYISHLLLSWILSVAHILGNLSWASISVSSFPAWFMFVLYTFYIWFLMFLHKKENSTQHF